MGCKESKDFRPGLIEGVKPDKINIIGFCLNADSRALQLYCDISHLDYNYIEINMLKGGHKTEEFKKAHPSMHMPILQDGVQSVYGSTLIQMMHMANRYQTKPDADRLHMINNIQKLNSLFAVFDQKVRPVTQRVRNMLIAKRLHLPNQPSAQQIDREKDELQNRILPMLNNALEGKRYFCGDQITGYDLQVYCEIQSMLVFAEELFATELQKQNNITEWMRRIDIIPEVTDNQRNFKRLAIDMLDQGIATA